MRVAIKSAIQALKRNKIRTFLTVFGITIGIAIVIIVLSAGNGVKQLVLSQVDSFGSDWINIEVKVPSADAVSQENASALTSGVVITSLTLEDQQKIVSIVGNIKNSYAGIISQAVSTYKNEKKQPTIFAVTHGFFTIDTGEIDQGYYFSKEDEDRNAEVVVLGADIAEDFFGNENPIDKKLMIGSNQYQVIGVMKKRESTSFFNFDEMLFIPIQTVQKNIIGAEYIQFIIAQIKDNNSANATAAEIRSILRDRHSITDPKDDDFSVTTQAESIEIIDTVFFGISALLVVLAAISLIVGGVGIMNVMYVSVIERTFEIGLRKSVGASEKDIQKQFLIEAIILTTVGGITGIISGVGISYVVAIVAQYQGLAWQFIISYNSIVLGTIFSVMVGVIFGYFPAKRASRLDPITALRNE